MLKAGPRSIITLIAVFALCMCIDPYSPKLEGYESLLVVEGMITDANTSYSVKLSRTIQEQTAIPDPVSDATVFISDGENNLNYLNNKGNGIYKTDSTRFRAIVGKTYFLNILTPDGKEYKSDPCLMQPVPDIDNISYTRDQKILNNGTENQEGILISVDSEGSGDNNFYRWEYEETWKFKLPNTKRYNYIDDTTILPVNVIKEYCWRTRKSNEVMIHQVYAGQPSRIEKEPIFFLASEKSDRLLIQYSILIKQYSISRQEYDFWDNTKKVNDSGGDIFAKQPFPVKSNIFNVSNPEEKVLGYFQVSGMKQKRKNIVYKELEGLNLPSYQYPCERIVREPKDYETPWGEKMTWNRLYYIFCTSSAYSFVEPIYVPGTFTLQKLVFSTQECADCELTGSIKKPDFWKEFE